jgi:O-methyltransferase involved in polyketide biosynthesis
MVNQERLQAQTVQSTMLLAIYGRAKGSRLFGNVLRDDEAIRIVDAMDYDFAQIDKSYATEYACLCCLVRAKRLGELCQDYMQKHPMGTVVNLGAGLDTTFERVDNGTIRWYNLDLPDSIAFRQRFIGATERSSVIAQSMFDYSWLDNIQSADGSVFVLAAGLFYYFDQSQVRELVSRIVGHFKAGEVCFDSQSKTAVRISNRMVRKSGNKGAQMKFWVNDASSLIGWSDKIRKVESMAFFGDVRKGNQRQSSQPKGKRYKLSTRLNMWAYDAFKMGSLVSIKW